MKGTFATVDKSIEAIFQSLNETGQLENTIVLGTGDHGDHIKGKRYGRLHTLDATILNPMLYMHIPKRFTEKGGSASYPRLSTETLRQNTKQLVSSLDFNPTLLHLLDSHRNTQEQPYPSTDQNCIRGVNLFDTQIAPDRVAWSIPGITRKLYLTGKAYMAFHAGTNSSLTIRTGWPEDNGMKIWHYERHAYVANATKTEPIDDWDAWRSILTNLSATEKSVLAATPKFTKSFLEKLHLTWNGNDTELINTRS
ncbi:MAG: hypothetical protein SGARI_007212 [Bacillariaceae sp.]